VSKKVYNATGKIQPKTQGFNISADVSCQNYSIRVKEGDWVEKRPIFSVNSTEKTLCGPSLESEEANVPFSSSTSATWVQKR